MLQKARPTQFEEIIAFVSLYHPGPMDLIPDFIDRMHGARFEYLHPLLSDVLAPTYGIMVYQEQVMQAAQVIGGYTLGGADLLRRAMGKKKVEEMVKQRATLWPARLKKALRSKKPTKFSTIWKNSPATASTNRTPPAYSLVAYPNRLAQSALSGRIHGRHHVERIGQHRPAQTFLR